MNNKKLNKLIFKSVLAIIFLVVVVNLYISNAMKPIDKNNNNFVSIEIPKGSNTSDIARILTENNLIKSDFVFRLKSKQFNYQDKYQAGNYNIYYSMSMEEIMKSIVQGNIVRETISFTIPEGYTFKQIVDKLENQNLINRETFIEIANNKNFDYKFLKEIKKGNNRLEGFLFPDTYFIFKNSTEEDIIAKMLDRFDEIFINDYYDRTDELGLSIKEVITLASIIEREAKLDNERPIVSSVFHNRLDIGMRLQSCATVQYAQGEVKSKLSTLDTKIDSPYNTYLYKNLPPGPIASPGKSSIKAALYPANTDYYYFVLKKGSNSHIFTNTYKEFLNAKHANR